MTTNTVMQDAYDSLARSKTFGLYPYPAVPPSVDPEMTNLFVTPLGQDNTWLWVGGGLGALALVWLAWNMGK
jgi:hypothetical protein